MASKAQQNYMAILFNDCGFTDNSRNVWLSNRFKRTIKYLDEVRFFEASDVVIPRLKEIRGDKT